MPTLIHRLHEWSKEAPHEPAQAKMEKGGWKMISSKEYFDQIFYLTLYLETKGFNESDTLAVLSYNRPESTYCEFAPHLLRGMSVGLYPSASDKDISFILSNTESRFIGIQNSSYFPKIKDIDQFETILVFEGETDFSEKAISFQDALTIGKSLAQKKSAQEYLDRLDPKRRSFLIYTSGTTGFPKGAMLSHHNFIFAGDAATKAFNIPHRDNGRFISFLPLCHVAEKMQALAVGISSRYTVYFTSKFEAVSKEMPLVKPTAMLSVPRLWEKMMEGIQKKIAAEPGTKGKVLRKIFELNQISAEREFKKDGSYGLSNLLIQKVSKELFVKKALEKLGIDELKCAGSGAAALPAHVARFFRSFGIEILEDFGQTETTGVTCMTVPGEDCAGTVGLPIENTDFKIADDGEILTRGDHVFLGYLKNDTATQETIDQDGWLHTGDLGKYNEKGYVQIVGRKKEIMKSSGGKMVAPVPIEELIKQSSLVSQACMVGDGKKFFSALITLEASVLNRIKHSSDAIEGVIVKSKEILTELEKTLAEVNQKLARYEQIKQFRVLSRDFLLEEDEVTPTLKMKRHVISKNFEQVIESMYE